MASENEASCVTDPNFAVICSFLECFGKSCGIEYPAIAQLQEMLENTQDGESKNRFQTHFGRSYLLLPFLPSSSSSSIPSGTCPVLSLSAALTKPMRISLADPARAFPLQTRISNNRFFGECNLRGPGIVCVWGIFR